MIARVRRRPLAAYVALTFALSWGYWVPVALAGGSWSHFPGLTGPMLAALAVTAVVSGRAGLRDLGARLVRVRVAWRWWAACLVPLAAAGLVLAVQTVAGDAPSFARISRMPGLPVVGWLGVFALVLLVNGYGEETGWRGFAWGRLRERHTLAGSAVLLTIPWSLWHLPTFWIDSGLRDFPLAMVPGWLIGMAAGAVVLGRLYERSGSLAVVAVFHALLNMASATRGTEDAAPAVSVAVIVWAVVLLRRDAVERARTRAAPYNPAVGL